MPTPIKHSHLPASSSERWLNCTPSAMLAAQLPNETSVYAEAGRIAHELGEYKLRKHFLKPEYHKSVDEKLAELRQSEHYDRAMEDATEEYYLAVLEAYNSYKDGAILALETRVDYSDIAPGGYGTADCIIVGEDVLTVMDYKNGSGVNVEAEGNTQMRLYAWGALRRYGLIYGNTLQIIRMIIVQPHAGGVKTWTISRGELTDWARRVVKPAAELAAKGAGDYRPGPWCDSHFCPARATCRARAKALLEAAANAPKLPPELTDEEVAEILRQTAGLDKWLASLKDYALTATLAGRSIPGFKAVEGRGSRDWNPGAFDSLMAGGIDEAILYEKKPVSVAGLEKMLGKKAFAEASAGLWTKRPGKPTLVPETDKRPAYDRIKEAFG